MAEALCGVRQPGRAHLDDAAAGLLEVVHLLAQGQGQLVGLGATGEVLAGEGPVQDGHGTCSRQRRSQWVMWSWALQQWSFTIALSHKHN